MPQLKKRQTDAVLALMQCDSVSEAAKQAGVSRSTLHRWLSEPVFQQGMRDARGKIHLVSVSRLCQLAGEAVSTLASGMRGGEVTKTQYLCACRILELSCQARDDDFQARLDEIEMQLRTFAEPLQ